MGIITIKQFLPLAAVLLMTGANANANAERTPPHVSSASGLRDVLAANKYEPNNLSDVDAEFVDFDEINQVGSGRRLQSGSTTTTTTCNTWCKLKESLGLTIVGLILVCIR